MQRCRPKARSPLQAYEDHERWADGAVVREIITTARTPRRRNQKFGMRRKGLRGSRQMLIVHQRRLRLGECRGRRAPVSD